MADDRKRDTRDNDTREATSRTKQWVNPNTLLDPPDVPGIAHRWVRAEMLGKPDKANMAAKMREGWEIAPASDYPSFNEFRSESGEFIERGGLILCRTDKEVVKQREAHYQKVADQQIASVDSNFMRENDARMPLLTPERQTSVRFGKGAEKG